MPCTISAKLNQPSTSKETTMSNLSAIQDHIEASAPCSLFSIGVWVDDQLNATTVELMRILSTLASAGTISITSDESGIIVDLI